MVRQLPVGPLAIRHHLPHDDAVTPHVAGRGELAVGNGLWGRPSDGDLAALQGTQAQSPQSLPTSPSQGQISQSGPLLCVPYKCSGLLRTTPVVCRCEDPRAGQRLPHPPVGTAALALTLVV